MSSSAWESGEFLLAFTASAFTFLGLVLRACLKSRCSNIKVCWGLWTCDRVVDEEAGTELEQPSFKENSV